MAQEHENAPDARTERQLVWLGTLMLELMEESVGKRQLLRQVRVALSFGEHPNGSKTEAEKITNIQAF